MLRELAAPDRDCSCSVEIGPYQYSSAENMIGIMTGLETEPIGLRPAPPDPEPIPIAMPRSERAASCRSPKAGAPSAPSNMQSSRHPPGPLNSPTPIENWELERIRMKSTGAVM